MKRKGMYAVVGSLFCLESVVRRNGSGESMELLNSSCNCLTET